MISEIRRRKTGHLAKMMFCLVIITLLVTSILIGCGPAKPKQLDQVTFRHSWVFTVTFAPAFLGKEKGFWADEGIDIVLLPGKGGSFNAVLIGRGVDLFNEGSGDGVVNSVAQGVPIKMIHSFMQKAPSAVISLAKSNIRTPKDLEGKTVAGGPDSAEFQLLPDFLKAGGADPDKVTMHAVTAGSLDALLMTGQVDAITDWMTDMLPTLKEQGLEGNALLYADYGLNIIPTGLLVADETIQENPDLVYRFVRAWHKALVYSMDHIDEMLDAYEKYNEVTEPRAAEVATWENIKKLSYTQHSEGHPFGWMAKEDWETTQNVMLKIGELEKALPVENYYTDQFIPQ